MPKISYIFIALLVLPICVQAQQHSTTGKDSSAKWTFHFQESMVNQWHGHYHFPYTGPSSLDSNGESKLSLTTTMFIGRKLWKYGAVYLSPEVTAGQGLSGTHGMAGFPNGEIYRVGNPTPTPFFARFYFQQSFALPGGGYDAIDDGLNQLAQKLPSSRITINVGKFCLADFFDGNTYNHDARTQFLNWSMMAAGAWDFPADTRGYTSGLEIELVKPKWTLRYAIVEMPRHANGLDMDPNLLKENGMTLEYQQNYTISKRPGILRIDVFRNSSTAPTYKQALNEMGKGDSTLLPVFQGLAAGPSYGGNKYGFGINAEQQIADNMGLFFRLSWNDGKTASWAFTDIDRSVQLGINMKGTPWQRPDDNFGIGGVVNGISKDHQDFLAAGGYTFIIGDGALHYGPECIMETYYRVQVQKHVSVSGDYQIILNPGYNTDRKGPIQVPALRVHIEF